MQYLSSTILSFVASGLVQEHSIQMKGANKSLQHCKLGDIREHAGKPQPFESPLILSQAQALGWQLGQDLKYFPPERLRPGLETGLHEAPNVGMWNTAA